MDNHVLGFDILDMSSVGVGVMEASKGSTSY